MVETEKIDNQEVLQMKKMVASFLIFAVLAGLAYVPLNSEKSSNDAVTANELPALENIQIGEHIQLGKYNNEPIIWQYVADDENGSLMLSDDILCKKIFGANNFWAESLVRKWLNSDVAEGEVNWVEQLGVLPEREEYALKNLPYEEEKGFLHKDNFSRRERSVIKSVTQWTMLPQNHQNLATNGIEWVYTAIEGEHKWFEDTYYDYYDISVFPDVYNGAAYQLEDSIFLLDEMQVYSIWKNFETVSLGKYGSDTAYYLRTPTENDITEIFYLNESSHPYTAFKPTHMKGIRPAFYLNEENAVILSGSGTEEDPYVLDGKENGDISVYCNEEKLWFDQPPIMESDRVLVPLRVIFETLGADIEWDGTTQTVTAVRGETNISLQIDSNMMYKNGEAIELDVPARLLNDRTLVPIRAVSEAMEAKVEWIQKDKTVVITTQ